MILHRRGRLCAAMSDESIIVKARARDLSRRPTAVKAANGEIVTARNWRADVHAALRRHRPFALDDRHALAIRGASSAI